MVRFPFISSDFALEKHFENKSSAWTIIKKNKNKTKAHQKKKKKSDTHTQKNPKNPPIVRE